MGELFSIQHCISGVIAIGLLEALLWYVLYNNWNVSGTRATALFIVSTLMTVVKGTVSCILVLVASLGWGMGRPYLEPDVLLKIQILAFLYIVMDFIREIVLAFRHSHSFSVVFVLLCLLPVSVLNGGIFSWVFAALSSLMDTLKERRQFEKLALFLLVLMAMMFLWAPHQNSQRFGFSQQIGMDDKDLEDNAGAIWGDEDEDDEDGPQKDSFWAATELAKTADPVDVIGSKS